MHPRRTANLNAKRPKVTHNGLDRLIAAAWDAGYSCERGRKNYVKCYPPDGKPMVVVAATPSDHRTYRNTRAEFRRRGLNV